MRLQLCQQWLRYRGVSVVSDPTSSSYWYNCAPMNKKDTTTSRSAMLERKLEYLMVLFFTAAPIALPVLCATLLPYLLYAGGVGRWFTVAYLIHLYFDWDTGDNGGRPSPWFRQSSFTRRIKAFFPITMVAEQPLPADRNHMIGLHPHGLWFYSLFNIIDHESESYKKVFGTAKTTFCVAHYNVQLPLQRDFMLALGSINASETSLRAWFGRSPGGYNAGLIIGGAEEAMMMSPKTHKIFLKRRKGFCRVALQAGADLVPSYSFGETLMFDTVESSEGSRLQWLQRRVYQLLGVGLVVLKGAGRFQYVMVMPRRRPVTLVLGKPVTVTKTEHPTREQINQLHERYVSAVAQLFDTHKHKYLQDNNAQLIID